MEYLQNDLDESQMYRRVMDWFQDSFDRHTEVKDLSEAINNPAKFAIELQATPEQACDLWARMIRRVGSVESIQKGIILVPIHAGKTYPDGYDEFNPDGQQDLTCELIRIVPKLLGHTVFLLLIEGMDPRDGLLVLDRDPEAMAILGAISDESLSRVLDAIHESRISEHNIWLDALCEEKPVSEGRIADIYKQYPHRRDAEDRLRMIRSCQNKQWSVAPISVDYIRSKFEPMNVWWLR